MPKLFKKQVQEKFTEMTKSGKLFRVDVTGQQVWDLYLKSFSTESDPVFRDPSSSVHNCNHCNNFIRRYGNIVSIDEVTLKITSMWDVEVEEEEYINSAEVMSMAIANANIVEVFFETYDELNELPYESCSKSNEYFRLGIDKNVKRYTKEEAEKYLDSSGNPTVKANEVITFNHFYVDLHKNFVSQSGKSVESIMADYRSAKEVFKRAMDGIHLDTLILVKDLITQGSLLDGQTHLFKVDAMLSFKRRYMAQSTDPKILDNWCWLVAYNNKFAKFKNELVGVLCSELSEGMELNKACQSWNKRVDPANYMKAIAPITKGQIDEAKKYVESNGYAESFNRRLATIDDIKVSEILHSNVGDGKLKSVSIFDGVKSSPTIHKRNEFEGVDVVGIDKFMSDILPGCTSVEVLLTNQQQGNLVTMTTAKVVDSKPIFKWNNNYSWTYNGNLAGKSQIKEAVKSQGGKVDGVLRFSIMWAEDEIDNSDLDAHCIEPDRNEIYFSRSVSRNTGGNLDIDITQPQEHKRRSGKEVVENITYPSLSKMIDGTYKLFVHQYAGRNSKGFKAEIEFDGQLYSYDYQTKVIGHIQVAVVTLKDGVFSIKHELSVIEGAGVSKEIYGLETNKFHKINMMCLSPNHWDGNNVGNKHYFFMIDGCKSELELRGFHNENLIPELAEHRKVLEVLGTTNMISPSEKQLSGLGFNATVNDELIVKLGGSFKRTLKIKFN